MRLPPKLVYVFGIHHDLQRPPDHFTPECWVLQIEAYRNELERLAAKNGFDIYCEEIDHGADTFAQLVARFSGKPYVNIDLQRDMREKCGIPFGYSTKALEYEQHKIDEWNRIREDYMYERVNERLGPESVALVLCGFKHMEPLEKRFKDRGGRVESVSVETIRWHDAELFKQENLVKLELSPTRFTPPYPPESPKS